MSEADTQVQEQQTEAQPTEQATEQSTEQQATEQQEAQPTETQQTEQKTVLSESLEQKQSEPEVKTVQPEEYKLPEGVPEKLRGIAAKSKLTQDALDEMNHVWGEHLSEYKNRYVEMVRDTGKEVLASWGDKKDDNIAIVKQALEKFDPDGKATDIMLQSSLIDHGAVIEMLLNVGKSLQEGDHLQSQTRSPRTKKTFGEVMYGEN